MTLGIVAVAMGTMWFFTTWALRRSFDDIGRAIILDDLGAQQGGGAVLGLGELRADPGFQGEAAQDTGAKRMDGLDLQPAGGFQRTGK